MVAVKAEEFAAFVRVRKGNVACLLTRDRRALSRFYRPQWAVNNVELDVAAVARVDPLEISPGAAVLRAYIERNPHARKPLVALARYLAKLGKGPLNATPDELASYLAHGDSATGDLPTLHRNWVRRFHGDRYDAHRGVSALAVVAGAFSASANRPDVPIDARSGSSRASGYSPSA